MADELKPRLAPLPGKALRLRYRSIEPGTIYHRFHMYQYPATEFNGTPNGRARFSPIRNLEGQIIPTLYGAETLDCAAMETIFRDLAHLPSPRHIDMTKFEGILHSLVRIEKPLKLVDLRSKALIALGMTRADLIDTDSSQYPYTQRWAEAIHANSPEAQGLVWTSKQDDSAQAIVLYGDRMEADALSHISPSLRVLHEEPTWSALLDLLEFMDVDAEF